MKRLPRKRLTPTQVAWLRDLANGVNPWLRKGISADLIGVAGRYKQASGSTHVSLYRAGLVSDLGDITHKGRQRLAELEPPARPPVGPASKLTGIRYMGYATRLVDVHRRWNMRRAERAAPKEPPAQ